MMHRIPDDPEKYNLRSHTSIIRRKTAFRFMPNDKPYDDDMAPTGRHGADAERGIKF